MNLSLKQNNLPKGWTLAELRHVVENPKKDIVDGPFGSNLKANEYIDTGIPVLKIQNIKANQFINKNIRFIKERKAKELNRHSFRSGDLIITKLGNPLGLCCKVPETYHYGIIVADLIRLRPSTGRIFDKYLTYAINGFFVQNQFKTITKGTTRPRVNLTIVRNIKIPYPSIPEQHQIVAKIEELFSELDNGIESLKKAREQLKTYRQAVLKYAFEGKLTKEWRTQQIQAGNPPEPAEKLLKRIKREREKHYQRQLEDWGKAFEQAKTEGKNKPVKPKKSKELPLLSEQELAELPELPERWSWARFGQIVDNLKRGPFGSSIRKEFFVPIGKKVYEQKNAIYKSETIGDYFISDEKFEELSNFEVNAGDYIVSCSGTIGKIYRLPKNSAKGVINQALLRIRISGKL